MSASIERTSGTEPVTLRMSRSPPVDVPCSSSASSRPVTARGSAHQVIVMVPLRALREKPGHDRPAGRQRLGMEQERVPLGFGPGRAIRRIC
jgi:hypothetical protein